MAYLPDIGVARKEYFMKSYRSELWFDVPRRKRVLVKIIGY
jgi:hypothetical protein